MPAFSLRRATAADQGLIKALVRDERLNPIGLAWPHFWLACDGRGQVIGCAQLKPHRDGSLELASLVVVEAWRGRGVARELVRRLQDEAGTTLWLMCREGLVPFYRRFAFVRLAEPSSLPPYFRRIWRLAGIVRSLFPAGNRLAIMVWQPPPGQPSP